CGLDGDYPGEGRAHDGVVEIALRDAHGPRDHVDIAALGGELRPHRVDGGLRIVHRRLADEVALHQGLLPLVVAFGIGEIDLGLGKPGFGIVELGARLIERRANIGIVELRDDLTGVDMVAFLDVELHHLCRDLGRHRGLTARHDVARGIEYRARGRRSFAGNRVRSDEMYGDGAGARPPPKPKGRGGDYAYAGAQPDPELGCGRRLAAIDAQLIEQGGFIIHAWWCRTVPGNGHVIIKARCDANACGVERRAGATSDP